MWERILQGLSITKHVSKVCVGRCSLLALVSVCAPCLTPIIPQIIFVRKPRMLRVARHSDASNAAGRAAAGGGPVVRGRLRRAAESASVRGSLRRRTRTRRVGDDSGTAVEKTAASTDAPDGRRPHQGADGGRPLDAHESTIADGTSDGIASS
jgi:hypothetical protein